MFSISTVASPTRIPIASASPLRVMMLSDMCKALSAIIELKMESGLETSTMSALRRLRQEREGDLMAPVRQAAIIPSCTIPSTAGSDEQRLVEQLLNFHSRWSCRLKCGDKIFICLTMSNVDTAPFFKIVTRTERAPSERTTFCRTAKPSLT